MLLCAFVRRFDLACVRIVLHNINLPKVQVES